MRERNRDRGRLQDIVEHASNVEKMMEGITYDSFYDTAVYGIPELRMQAERYIAEIDWNNWERGEEISAL